jgi:hypothetical protein
MRSNATFINKNGFSLTKTPSQVDHYELCIRLFTTVYGVVYDRIFSVLHGPVLRSYVSVTVYEDIRRKTEIVNDRIFSYTAVNDRLLKSDGALTIHRFIVLYHPCLTIEFIPKSKPI